MTVLQFAQINEINQTFTVKIESTEVGLPGGRHAGRDKRLASVDTSTRSRHGSPCSFGRSGARPSPLSTFRSWATASAMEREAGVDIDGDDKVDEEPELDGPRRKLYMVSPRHGGRSRTRSTFAPSPLTCRTHADALLRERSCGRCRTGISRRDDRL